MSACDTDPENRWDQRVSPAVIGALRPFARALRSMHRVVLDGVENLPRGPALLIGNHGLLGYETLLFFDALLEATDRMPLGLADRWFFKVPLLRDVIVRAGGMYGCRATALRALGRGSLVVCYPGGAREVLKREDQKYRLQWGKSLGFIRLAIEAGVPLVPFAAAGVDDTFDVVSRARGTGRLLMGHDKYDLPLLWGRGPLPRAVPFIFRIGAPIQATEVALDDEVSITRLHRSVWERAQMLVDGVVAEWGQKHRSSTRKEAAA